MSKKQLAAKLDSVRLLTYNQWIEFGEYLMENTEDPIIQNYYKSLSRKFLEAAKIDGEANPTASRLAVTDSMGSAEAGLYGGGWK